MAEQYGFYVDTSRCIKCWACQVACKQWHGIKANTVARREVKETVEGTFPNVKRKFESLSCMHCEKPACFGACPQGAIEKRADDGIVTVNLEKCIGDKSCAEACPFDVPEFIERDGKTVMDKCDTCLSIGRNEDGNPHCVAACPLQALHFGPLAEMAKLAAEKGGKQMEGETVPSVYVS